MTKLGLHWGKNFFSLFEFSQNEKDGWKLRRGITLALSPHLGDSPQEREKVAEQLQTTLACWGIRKATLHVWLAADKIFLRTVAVPVPTGLEESIPRLIEIEAARIFPVPLKELTWNFSPLVSLQDETLSVVYAAVKNQTLAPLLEIFSKIHAEIKTISPAPAAFYHALGLVGQLRTSSLLLEINAASITVISLEPQKTFSSYTLATSSLQKPEEVVRSILEHARAQKIVPTHLFLSGKVECKNRFRSFFQKNEHLVVGDLDEQVKEYLSFTQEGLHFFDDASVHSWSYLAGAAKSMNDLTVNSLASSNVVFTKKRAVPSAWKAREIAALELKPSSLLAQQHSRKQRPYFVGALGLLLCTFLMWAFYFQCETQRLTAAAARKTIFLDQEQKKCILSDQATAEFHKIEEERDALDHLLEARAAWPTLIQELQHALPARYLWITKLSPALSPATHEKIAAQAPHKKSFSPLKNFSSLKENDSDSIGASHFSATEAPISAIEIDGLYLENSHEATVVDDFVERLKKSDFFVIKNKEEIVLLQTPPDGTAYAYPFQLLVPLRKPINREMICAADQKNKK